jgi:hypothetical protein
MFLVEKFQKISLFYFSDALVGNTVVAKLATFVGLLASLS